MKQSSQLFLALAALSPTALPAAAQNQVWIHQLGTVDRDDLLAATRDGSGGVYVGGVTGGSIGGTSAGFDDAWLARRDALGNQVWIRQLGTSSIDSIGAAAPDGSGGVYVGGATLGSLGAPNAGFGDVWLARYDGAGTSAWLRQFGTSTIEVISGAAPDAAGGVYVAGTAGGSLGGPSAGGADAWLARYDNAGNRTWILQFGSNGNDSVFDATVDGSGGVYIGGRTTGPLGGPGSVGGAWLARYDSTGSRLWMRQFGSSNSGNDALYAAAPDGSGGVYGSGYTYGNLGGTSAGGSDAWLVRYDDAGNQLWTRQLGTGSTDEALAAAPDGSGGVHVGGVTRGSLGGSNPDPSGNTEDAWLAHYDGAGTLTGIVQLGTGAADHLGAAAPDGFGGVYIGGRTGGSLGGASSGGEDAWVARYDGYPVPRTYCTAKVNSCASLPSMGFAGTPSATSGSGFTVHVDHTKALKAGLLIYTDSGRGNAPFAGGILCLDTASLKRAATVVDTSGTPGQCNGTLALDMNAFAAGKLGGHPLPSLSVPGTQINCQMWGRDNVANGALLSDALEYFVGW